MEVQQLDLVALDYSIIYFALIQPILFRAAQLLIIIVAAFFAFLLYAFVKYRVNPFRLNIERLRTQRVRFKLFDCIRWVIVDIADKKVTRKEFDEYGFTIYCGRQGAGKTVSMVDYLYRMRKKYPDCLIVTNFACNFANHRMTDWRDFFKYRNEIHGVIFALDEIHSEYNNASWKDFPESLLSEISQQRKQRIKIVATSQQYSRVVKQIREQCFSVVQCFTFMKRWTFCKEYDALDYEMYCEKNVRSPKGRFKHMGRWSFVQSPGLRGSFDTYEKIERLKGREFIPRNERVQSPTA